MYKTYIKSSKRLRPYLHWTVHLWIHNYCVSVPPLVYSRLMPFRSLYPCVIWVCEILHLLFCKKEVVISWFFQSAASTLCMTGRGILVKNHRNSGFQLKLRGTADFYSPWRPLSSSLLVSWSLLPFYRVLMNTCWRNCTDVLYKLAESLANLQLYERQYEERSS